MAARGGVTAEDDAEEMKHDAEAMLHREDARLIGLAWVRTGNTKPTKGEELTNSYLEQALTSKTEFTLDEWEGFGPLREVGGVGGITNLRLDHFVKSGGFYFQPRVGEAKPLINDEFHKTLVGVKGAHARDFVWRANIV